MRVSGSISSSGYVSVSWSAVSGAAYYQVFAGGYDQGTTTSTSWGKQLDYPRSLTVDVYAYSSAQGLLDEGSVYLEYVPPATFTASASANITGPSVSVSPTSGYVGNSVRFTADDTYIQYGDWTTGASMRTRYINTYTFSQWSLSGVSGASPTSNNPVSRATTSTSVLGYATYSGPTSEQVVQYKCVFSASPAAGGTITYTSPTDTPNWYTSGLSITIKANANSPYYRFKQWSDGNTNDERTFTVNQAYTLTAIFEEITFDVLTRIGNSAIYQARVNGSSTVPYNGSVSVEAILQSDYSTESIVDGTKTITTVTYSFDHWDVQGSSSVSTSSSRITLIDDIQSDITATAYGNSSTSYSYQYSYSGTIGNSYISRVEGGGWVDKYGTTGYLTATAAASSSSIEYGPNNDYRYTHHEVPYFDHWTYTGSASSTSTTIDAIQFSNVQSPIHASAFGSVSEYNDSYEYYCGAYVGTGIATATVSNNWCAQGSSCTWDCTPQPDYEFIGWYDGTTKISSVQRLTLTVGTSAIRLTAQAQRLYQVDLIGTSGIFSSITSTPPSVSIPATVSLVATKNTDTDQARYYFDRWQAVSGTISFEDYTDPTTSATISATGTGDLITIMAVGHKEEGAKYYARFQTKSEGLGTVSVSKEQSFGNVTFTYTPPNNCYVFVGWYSAASGGSLISSNSTYVCPAKAAGSTTTLYARINFAYANSSVIQWRSAQGTLKAADWLTIKNFINARKSTTYSYIENIPSKVYTGSSLTVAMYNEYASKLNLTRYTSGKTITAECINLIASTINGII